MNSLAFSGTANLIKVPAAATDPAARETVATGLKIAGPFPASKEQRERHNMATTAQLLNAYIKKPAVEISTDMRLETQEAEYRIRGISGWGAFVELLLEAEK